MPINEREIWRQFSILWVTFDKKHNSRLAMDASTPRIRRSNFATHDWTSFMEMLRKPSPTMPRQPVGELSLSG